MTLTGARSPGAKEDTLDGAAGSSSVDCTELGFTGCNLDTDFGCTPGILG